LDEVYVSVSEGYDEHAGVNALLWEDRSQDAEEEHEEVMAKVDSLLQQSTMLEALLRTPIEADVRLPRALGWRYVERSK
jgi:hypothetical protein